MVSSVGLKIIKPDGFLFNAAAVQLLTSDHKGPPSSHLLVAGKYPASEFQFWAVLSIWLSRNSSSAPSLLQPFSWRRKVWPTQWWVGGGCVGDDRDS